MDNTRIPSVVRRAIGVKLCPESLVALLNALGVHSSFFFCMCKKVFEKVSNEGS